MPNVSHLFATRAIIHYGGFSLSENPRIFTSGITTPEKCCALFRNETIADTVVFHTEKKPTAQIAHLVFASTKSNAEKPKEQFSSNAL